MSLRGSSGKFSLSNFSRKVSGPPPAHAEPNSPTTANGYGNGAYDEDDSPTRDTHGGAGFDGLKKLKGTFAHNSLLPGLGNKDLRALQDIITAEKGVMQGSEKLAMAASTLPAYGIQEGPDLQDILSQSSTLLSQLTTALNVFASHQGNMRTCYKRIREREEQLMDLRSRRRTTGSKADNAERKLAKMGPENKQLPQQTELLERLRGEMRSMDQDILTEETKIGDFKRQVIKEALSLKFGGLEELGEKMCIVGELGKLMLEEVPLEETPIGYGRAPYTGYDKTESAVNEATRCFHASNSAPKAPGLPQPPFGQSHGAASLPRHESSIAAAEEYAHYPNNAASPETQGQRDFTLDSADPYGGIGNPYAPGSARPTQQHLYSDFGGTRLAEPGEVMFQAPAVEDPTPKHDEHHAHFDQDPEIHATTIPAVSEDPAHEYELEQQKAMDAEEAWKKLDAEEQAWKEQAANEHNVAVEGQYDGPSTITNPQTPEDYSQDGQQLKSPWEPLNVKRGVTPDPSAPLQHQEASVAAPPLAPALPLGEPLQAQGHADPAPNLIPAVHEPEPDQERGPNTVSSPTHIQLPPPRPVLTPGPSEFYTPNEIPDRAELFNAPRASTPTTGGKISAAAFRRGTKPTPRTSLDPEYQYDPAGSESGTTRRLPLPPAVGYHSQAAGIALPASPAPGQAENPYDGVYPSQGGASPPPGYATHESLR
ncbi:hypothetical protein IAU60_006444 [Kwoniella sp. DSM 27419]